MKADYYSRVNHDLLKLIPPDVKLVLEIGCGAGALAKAYQRINPEVKWLGVEPNEEACKIAESHGVDVMNATVEDWAWMGSDDDDGLADCLIFGDVLEHLEDPWNVLKKLSLDVHPGAQVLASIPNIQHFSVLYSLLFGHFKYTDEGVMDRTHLRWFTLEGIREMFDQAGLQIHEIRGIRSPADGDGWKVWSEFMAPLNIDLRQTAPLQYLVRAVKPPAQIENIHIHAVIAEACCARPRIHEPFEALSTIPGVKCTTSQRVGAAPDSAQIIIQQRFRDLDLVQQAEDIKSCLLIAELDDDPVGLQGYPENDYIQLRAVHAVQVSTEQMAKTVREWNPNVMVFENQIADLPPWKDKEPCDEVAIFYGAQNRKSDWEPIMPALHRIVADHPEVHFRVVCDRDFFDALPGKKMFRPFLEYDEYRKWLRSCRIALLPLEPTPFNLHKSDIKFLECAAEGVACVMSETVYKNSWLPERGELYNNAEQFESVLRWLIDHPNGRHEESEKAYTYVRDHRLLGQHFRKRLAWYQDLLQSKEDLDRQLFERVPELRSAQSACSSNHP